jgi:tRNA nucleotidyltransferase (CCA-adding enzyme)
MTPEAITSLLAAHPKAPLLAKIGAAAAAAGWRTAVVGGFVRDLLLGIINQDLDIAVEGDALACSQLLAETLGGEVVRTSRFGTAVLALADEKIDLAMARKERYPRPGALPEVRGGTLEDDLFRRDFSINAMALELSPDRLGCLLDPFGGRADLAAAVIRVLHPQSFSDDPTRLLRAVRLAHRMKFTLAADTEACWRQAIKGRYWRQVSPARLGREVRLLFAEDDWSGMARRLEAGSLFWPLFALQLTTAKAAALARAEAALTYFDARGLPVDRLTLAAMAVGGKAPLLLDKKVDGLHAAAAEAAQTLAGPDPGPRRLYLALHDLPPPALAYLWIICQNDREQGLLKTYIEDLRHVAPVLDVAAIIDLAGRGPQIKAIRRELLYARLDGRLATREEELALVEAWAKDQPQKEEN